MAAKLLLPDHVIARLRCDLCRGYLSVPPISSHEDKVSCGRCDPGWQRNSAYEHLAQFVLFPCTYCAEKLAWSEVAAHEQKCKRDIILCPALYEKNYKLSKMPRSNLGEYHADCQARAIACPFDYCDAKYAARDVPGHFRKYHEEYIFDDSQVVARKNMKAEKVWNFNSDNQVCLLAYKQMPFLLFVHSDCQYDESTGDIVSYDYFFGVFTFCLNRCDVKYTASITLASDQDSTTHTMKNQDIKPFNPSLHSVNLLRIGLIRHRSFDFMTTRFRNLPRLPNLKLTYTVKILDGFDAAERPIPKPRPNIKAEGLGRNFECPICKEYMHPPVYNCELGHSVCKSCKSKMAICPFCKAVIGNSRNFVFEDILESLQVACHNEERGCGYVGKVQDLKLHELMCVFNM